MILGRYHSTIENMRSHHWKYFLDLYDNCYFNCTYCLYRTPDYGLGKVRARQEILEDLEQELSMMAHSSQEVGIVYLGPTADVYQPLERKRLLTRKVLQLFAKYRVPTFIVTRSDLALRDIDILQEMAKSGLVEISISIPSAQYHPAMEPHSPTISERLTIAEDIAQAGVPLSIHFSPIIPYLDELDELTALLSRMADTGAQCIYACLLGMREFYKEDVIRVVDSYDRGRGTLLRTVYANDESTYDLQAPEDGYVYRLIGHLSRYSAARGIPFASVQIPAFDTIERTGHIFRYKLPTVGDIARHFVDHPEISWEEVKQFVEGFPATDSTFHNLVHKYWDNGQLLKNTMFSPDFSNGDIPSRYVNSKEIDLKVSSMIVKKGENEG
ncbi:hypothetical protein TPY_3118 [Sulfobacillus acidophilus TPY]|uniref:Radical SAM domain protein n=1 Tax=Sulfobacillus acidophilus (strain ATCC 700253 / DSM 10332 / NAL) TaxID=679936 RepID=G8TZY5_SULAD|nr:hypothetical protein TPY_3118 [Sulfobacillus acidophilus TPY]AEW04154.1 Radical SAM domain protein [Sulfobacillus acidophilus DSM 10332]